jgi:hypothetical protein
LRCMRCLHAAAASAETCQWCWGIIRLLGRGGLFCGGRTHMMQGRFNNIAFFAYLGRQIPQVRQCGASERCQLPNTWVHVGTWSARRPVQSGRRRRQGVVARVVAAVAARQAMHPPWSCTPPRCVYPFSKVAT